MTLTLDDRIFGFTLSEVKRYRPREMCRTWNGQKFVYANGSGLRTRHTIRFALSLEGRTLR